MSYTVRLRGLYCEDKVEPIPYVKDNLLLIIVVDDQVVDQRQFKLEPGNWDQRCYSINTNYNFDKFVHVALVFMGTLTDAIINMIIRDSTSISFPYLGRTPTLQIDFRRIIGDLKFEPKHAGQGDQTNYWRGGSYKYKLTYVVEKRGDPTVPSSQEEKNENPIWSKVNSNYVPSSPTNPQYKVGTFGTLSNIGTSGLSEKPVSTKPMYDTQKYASIEPKSESLALTLQKDSVQTKSPVTSNVSASRRSSTPIPVPKSAGTRNVVRQRSVSRPSIPKSGVRQLTPTRTNILKRSGQTQAFNRIKLQKSITRAGATKSQANLVSNRVISRIGNRQSISSKELSKMTARSLSRVNTTASRNYTTLRNKKYPRQR